MAEHLTRPATPAAPGLMVPPMAARAAIAEQLRRQVPGLSVATVGREGVRWVAGFGLADLATRRAATAGTVYPWFSMTKIVTATAVVQLAERGALGLDDTAATYLPEYGALFRPAGVPPVTIRHLLSHSAGLPNPLPIGWVHPAGQPGPEPTRFLRRLLAKHGRLSAPPGTTAAYSNLGYLVLGEIIARAAGQPYQQYVCEQLLRPLGMHRTDFVYRDDLLPDAATGYHPRWNVLTPLLPLLLPRGILGKGVGRYVAFRRFLVDGAAYGGLIGPVEDAAWFLHLHLAGGAVEGRRLLSAEAVAGMQCVTATGPKLDVGLGWFRQRSERTRGPRHLEHLGGGAGFWNDMRLYPDLGWGVVLMGNATRYDHQRVIAALAGGRGK